MEIVELLGMILYKILTTDGTLFHTNARYKGLHISVKTVISSKLKASLKMFIGEF
ncbi:conserved hypothetical protein [delta proteobacterium NaphS2]|nr:conserved hypothetical protein [delta proteobacterium NaphS2]